MNKLTFKSQPQGSSKPANKALLPGGSLKFKKDAIKAQKELIKTDFHKKKDKIENDQFLLTKRAVEPRKYYIYQWHYENRHDKKIDQQDGMPIVENHFEPKKRLKQIDNTSQANEKPYRPLGPDPKSYMTKTQQNFFKLQEKRIDDKKEDVYLKKMEKLYEHCDSLYDAFEMPVEKHY